MESLEEKTSTIAEGLKEVGILSPDRTPNHLIATAALSSLTFVSSIKNYPMGRFVVVASFLAMIAVISLWFIARTAPLEGERYAKGLRLARTLGLVSACIAFVVSWTIIERGSDDQFIWLVGSALIQCVVFVLYLLSAQQALDGVKPLFIPDVRSRLRRINNQQLCIVTATLMVGMSFNASVSRMNRPFVTELDSSAVKAAELDQKRINEAIFVLDTYAARLNEDWFAQNDFPSPSSVRDSLSRIWVSIPPPIENRVYQDEHFQHRLTTWIFRVLWLAVMLLWGYQLLPRLEIRLKSPRIDEPAHSQLPEGTD